MSIRASLFCCGVAIAINAVALVVTHLSWERNRVHHASFVLLSIIVSTLYASFKPALLAVALNVIVFHYLLASLHEGGAFTELLRRSMFATVAVLLAVLVSARRRRVRRDAMQCQPRRWHDATSAHSLSAPFEREPYIRWTPEQGSSSP